MIVSDPEEEGIFWWMAALNKVRGSIAACLLAGHASSHFNMCLQLDQVSPPASPSARVDSALPNCNWCPAGRSLWECPTAQERQPKWSGELLCR
mmetsp:Transcript_8450/g.16289  ORF Transcript_8450/g.16289 Transcript_8450/m.16289 type:complete len:94 (-) Transcript_8450:470-751(-)